MKTGKVKKPLGQDPLAPPITTLVKLGSLIVHYQEWFSITGHPNDRSAIETLENDPEVIAGLDLMTKAAFLPIKR